MRRRRKSARPRRPRMTRAPRKLMAEVAELKTTMPELELAAKTADEELAKELAAIPNLPLDEVPEGADEHGNVQRHVFGKIRNYGFTPKPHDDLGGALGYMDFEAAAKLSRRALCRAEKGPGAAGACDRAVHARSAHQRAWLYRDQSAAAGAQRRDVRHRTIAEIRGRPVLGHQGRIACGARRTIEDRASRSHPHRRSLADQPRPRIHRRRKRTADAADRADAVLPRRSGRGGPRYPRHDPAASVHKSRAGVDRDARDQPRRA